MSSTSHYGNTSQRGTTNSSQVSRKSSTRSNNYLPSKFDFNIHGRAEEPGENPHTLNFEQALSDFASPPFDHYEYPFSDNYEFDGNDQLEPRSFDTLVKRVGSLSLRRNSLKRSLSKTQNLHYSEYGENKESAADNKSTSINRFPSLSYFDDIHFNHPGDESIENKHNTQQLSLHSFHQHSFPSFSPLNNIDTFDHLDHLDNVILLNSAGKTFSPFITSSKQTRSSAGLSSDPLRRLTFLENLESIPTESDIYALRSLSTSIRTGVVDQASLVEWLSSFGSLFQDISTRANYWGWAPKYFSFIYKILQGSHGPVSNLTVLNYCSALLSYLACLMTKFDYNREPSIQRYFIKKALPRLVEITGKYNTKFDTPSLAMMYICFHLNVDEHLVGFLMDLRYNVTDFFTNNKNKILRYRRAFWFASICNRLLIQNDLNGGSAATKELLFQCISEAQVSYTQEKELLIKSAYNKFFHFSDKKKKYPDSETKYRDFGDGLVGIPVMIQNQMDVILKNGDINGAGGKLMYKLKKLIKN